MRDFGTRKLYKVIILYIYWLLNFQFSNFFKVMNNTISVKSARAMWKVLMVQKCDNDILEGLVVTNPPPSKKPKIYFFLIGRIGGYRFYFSSKPTIEVKCSLIN
jgi:hypothetical protein